MSEPRDEWLAGAFRTESEGAHPAEDCPGPERIWDAVHLQLPVDERAAVIDHVSTCPACAEAWRLAMELGASPAARAPLPSPAPARSLATQLRANSWPLAAAAALVLMVGVAFVARSFGPAAPIPREPGSEALASRIQEGASFPKDDFWLRWTAGPTGSRYDLVVTTKDSDVVADARGLDVTEYRVPPERLAALAPGTPLLWRVVARTPEGTTISSRTLEASVR